MLSGLLLNVRVWPDLLRLDSSDHLVCVSVKCSGMFHCRLSIRLTSIVEALGQRARLRMRNPKRQIK